MRDKAKIIKVRKNPQGDITDVMLENGNIYSVDEAISMAKHGIIEGVNVGRAKNGREFLRSNPNNLTNDNLDNIATFE